MWSCNSLKKTIFETLYFIVTNVFSVSKLILWYQNMSLIVLTIWFKIRMYLLNREKRFSAFPRSTYIFRDLNELPTDKIHSKVRVPQDRLLCHTHVDNKNQRPEGTEGSAIKNHLIKRPFWYNFIV